MANDPPGLAFRSDTLTRWRTAAVAVTAADLLGDAATLGVVVPHADDETLGCGGLIAAAAALGVAVTVTVLTDGAASHPGSCDWPPARLAAARRSEARAAVARLTGGRGQLVFADAPDGRLAEHPEAAQSIGRAARYVTCWRDDPHPDHSAAFAMAQGEATRHAAPLLAFPLWTLTTGVPPPDLPLLMLSLGADLQVKRQALAAHRSQLGQLVTDVRGFVLDAHLQDLFVRPDELFVRVR